MSFVSIRCPNCAAADTIPVGENKYQCRYCDNTFHYVDPDAPKITKNISVQESHNCPNCGRGITVGTGNRCTKCGTNDFCSNCVFETTEKKLVCKNCIAASSWGCYKCGNYSIYRCHSCVKLNEKDPSLVITAVCAEHLAFFEGMGKCPFDVCPNCGFICTYCMINVSDQRNIMKCKNCGDKLKKIRVADPGFLKNQDQRFANWHNSIKST
jgi:predicted RNA-binding Zn-ribbon protein involved in translation (DUF1610 family)